MTLQTGRDVILKIGDGGSPEAFTTIGGLRHVDFVFTGSMRARTTMASQGWREVLDEAGGRSVTVAGDGFFSDSASEEALRAVAFARSIRNYELVFGNGSKFSGAFKIVTYGRYGKFRETESYKITLESAGVITFTPAA